ncbi:hypothetical protein [Halomonas sp. Y3]|uniref:hypothetical protein n=1 Tax=Halomonas sp. Y3 TaxID=2956797 RepID=UPI00209D7E53|nr:hypothetical protein [Halomonas sp. Y3]
MSPFAPWSVYKNRVSEGTTVILTLGVAQGESLPIRLDIDGDGGIHYAHGDGTPMSDDEARVLRRHAGE